MIQSTLFGADLFRGPRQLGLQFPFALGVCLQRTYTNFLPLDLSRLTFTTVLGGYILNIIAHCPSGRDPRPLTCTGDLAPELLGLLTLPALYLLNLQRYLLERFLLVSSAPRRFAFKTEGFRRLTTTAAEATKMSTVAGTA